jgi:2-polyprenyl-3-methyl-5-hydroxy-6-metoxy-1,4-benzoquinol methylase
VAADGITDAIREIQDRVRARYPDSTAGASAVPLPDLLPIAHARDAAGAKVAAIGTVNPRPPGFVNNIAQAVKRLVSRSLDWHVREQIEFNHGVMACVESTLSALNEFNYALHQVAQRNEAALAEIRAELATGFVRIEESAGQLAEEARELKDIRTHWSQWRQEWERKLSVNEVQFLRSVADLQAASQHRATLMESNFRDIAGAQHRDFTGALERSSAEMQKRMWEDFGRIREEYERLIHNELRVIRQRASAVAASAANAAQGEAAPLPSLELNFDSLRFADRFRGTPDYVKENQRFYVPHFQGCADVLDIGCGRGEFLSAMKDAGLSAHGIDLSEECVAICRSQGLQAVTADLFPYLENLDDASLDGIFCGQVVEHLPPERLPEFARLAAGKLRRGGVIAIETPNPECLAIFATHFYLDPTHTRPVPAPLLVFYLEEVGFGRIEVHKRFPVEESIVTVRELPREFLDRFFGALDYAVVARRL